MHRKAFMIALALSPKSRRAFLSHARQDREPCEDVSLERYVRLAIKDVTHLEWIEALSAAIAQEQLE